PPEIQPNNGKRTVCSFSSVEKKDVLEPTIPNRIAEGLAAMGPQCGRINECNCGVNLVSVGRYGLAKPGTGLDFRLPVVADFCLDHNRPAIRFLDEDIRATTLFKNSAYIFGVESPGAPKVTQNLCK